MWEYFWIHPQPILENLFFDIFSISFANLPPLRKVHGLVQPSTKNYFSFLSSAKVLVPDHRPNRVAPVNRSTLKIPRL